MPDLTIVAKLVGGQKTGEELDVLNKKYKDVGDKGEESFKKAEHASGIFGRGLNTVKSIAGGLALAFGGMEIASQIRHWTEAVFNFEEEWAKVKTLLDESPESVSRLKGEMSALGVDFGTSAERARGMFSVIKAGFEETKAVSVLEQAMMLAQTAFISTDEAINLLKVSLNAFDKSADEAQETAQKLFVILSRGGGVGAGELAMAFSRLAPMAKDLGVSMEDIGVTMGTLKERGMSSMQAFMALNLIMTKMTETGSKMNKFLVEHGAELSKTVIREKGFAYVLSELKDVIKGDVEVGEQLGLGIRQLGPILTLTGTAYDRYREKLKATTESARLQNKAWEEVNDTVKDKWGDTIVAVERKLVSFLDKSTPLKAFLDGVIETIESGVPPLNAFTFSLGMLGGAVVLGQLVSLWKALVNVKDILVAINRAQVASGLIGYFTSLNQVVTGATASMGLLSKAVGLVGVAWATWSIVEWIEGVTGLDVAISGLLTKMGLFRTQMPTATPEQWKNLEKAADVYKKYGEELKKVGIDISRGSQSYDQYAQSLAKATQWVREHGVKTADTNKAHEQAIKLTKEETSKYEDLEKALKQTVNPLSQLVEKIELLVKAGKTGKGGFNPKEFVTAFSGEILQGISLYEQLGKRIPPAVEAMRDLARQFEDGKKAAGDATAAQQKYVDAVAAQPQLWAQLTDQLRATNQEGYLPTLKSMHDNYAAMLLATGQVKDLGEAEDKANAKTAEFARMFQNAKIKLVETTGAIDYAIPATQELVHEFEKLGFVAPIGSMGQLKDELLKLKGALNLLGIDDTDLRIKEMEKAFNKLATSAGVTAEKLVQGQLALDKARLEGGRRLTDESLDQLRRWAFGQDKVLREKALPVWQAYVEQVKEINGNLPAGVLQDLVTIMTGTDKMLKEKLLPMWEEYVKAARDTNGKLPPEIDKLNKQITRSMEKESGKMAEIWANQVSTIVSDFAKGVTDIIFEGKSLTETLTGIFKEAGKSILRTFMEQLFAPMKNQLADMAGSLGNILSGGGAKTGGRPGFGLPIPGMGQGFGVLAPGAEAWQGSGAGAGIENAGGLSSMAGGFMGIKGWSSEAGGGGFMQKGGGIGGKGVGGVGGALLQAGGMMAFMDGLKRGGLLGSLEMIGGGAATGMALGGPIGAAIGAAVGAITAGIKAILGKSTAQAGAMEAARDFGNVKIGQTEFKDFYQGLGLTDKTAAGIRKDLQASPKFLVEILGPLAKAQGLTEQFKTSLEKVSTAWGTFDFRKEYELGEVTGDWTALDKAFQDAFEHSDALAKNLPTWRDALSETSEEANEAAKAFQALYREWEKSGKMTEDFVGFLEENAEALDKAAASSALFAAELEKARTTMARFKELKPVIEGFTSMKDGLDALGPAAENMYEHFLNTGEILPELEAEITKYGGDLERFKKISDLTEENNTWVDAVELFKQTGEILPELREEIEKFGGDLSALDDAARLPGLQQKINEIADFRNALNAMLPELTGLQMVMQGEWGEDTVAALTAQGYDPTKFEKMTNLIRMQKGWQDELAQFQKSPHLQKGGLIAAALGEFGGEEGLRALDRYNKGFAAISPELLKNVKKTMDKAFREERSRVLDYLSEIEEKTSTEITQITEKINAQFKLVTDGIAKAFEEARKAALEELDKILKAVNDAVNASGDVTIPGGGLPGTGVPTDWTEVIDGFIELDETTGTGLKNVLGGAVQIDATLVAQTEIMNAHLQVLQQIQNNTANLQMGGSGVQVIQPPGVEPPPAPEMISNPLETAGNGSAVTVDLRGAQIYSMDDFRKRVTQAVTSAYQNGGLQVLRTPRG